MKIRNGLSKKSDIKIFFFENAFFLTKKSKKNIFP